MKKNKDVCFLIAVSKDTTLDANVGKAFCSRSKSLGDATGRVDQTVEGKVLLQVNLWSYLTWSHI